jgi:hypothetical protein
MPGSSGSSAFANTKPISDTNTKPISDTNADRNTYAYANTKAVSNSGAAAKRQDHGLQSS